MNWNGIGTIAAVLGIGGVRGWMNGGSANILDPKGPPKEKAEIEKINARLLDGTLQGVEICADTVFAPEILADGSIQSIITSPPYYDVMQYTRDEREMGREGSIPDYINALTQLFVLLLPKLKENGTLWVNISDTKNSLGIGTLLALALGQNGYDWRYNITWTKANPAPTGNRDLQKVTEYILGFSKKERKPLIVTPLIPKTSATKSAAAFPRKRAGVGVHMVRRAKTAVTAVRTHKVATNSWVIQNTDQKRIKADTIDALHSRFSGSGDLFAENMWGEGRLNLLGHKHPAPMNTRVIKRILFMSTRKGDVVYDPFSGSGAVGKTAKLCGRIGIGCELSPLWARLAVIADTVRIPPADFEIIDQSARNPETGRPIIEPLPGGTRCDEPSGYDPSRTAFLDLLSRRISRRPPAIKPVTDTEFLSVMRSI